MDTKWHALSDTDVLEKLDTSRNGITENEALKRLQSYGKNVLPQEKKNTIFHILIGQFQNPIILILCITIVFCLLIHEELDALLIGIVILLNTVLGTFQEYKAGKSAESLKQLIQVKAKVLRNGKEMIIPSEEIVPGDIVFVESGTRISADMRLLAETNITIDESTLTGESVAASKENIALEEDISLSERKNMLYAGTSVLTGRGKGIVVGTAQNTEIGKIAGSIFTQKETKSPLMIRMEKFTKQIGIIVGLIAIFLCILLYFRGYPVKDIFFSVVALCVSAIPEGLPVALLLALSIASNRMAKRNVIVKKLNAVESLGSCTVIASDKTGTLTVNEQTAKKIVLPNGESVSIGGTGYNDEGGIRYTGNQMEQVQEISRMGAINNEASLAKEQEEWVWSGDSIDIAFLSLAYKVGVMEEKNEVIITHQIPYESEQKYAATFYQEKDIYCTVKGSVEVVLSFCKYMGTLENQKSLKKQDILKQNEELAKEGYRVIALAQGKHHKKSYTEKDIADLTFIGLVAFIDPIREDAIRAVETCKKAGIKVVMITGDHPLTAYAIAKELHIADEEIDVSADTELEEMIGKGPEALDAYVKQKTVFTRATPLQKYEIVESYKRQNEFIAVTGDGVNDAPALKAANIGIAMGSGTDVAKEAANMIIKDDNFLSIVAGVEEGRKAYNNVRKVIYLLLSTGMAEVLLFALSILWNLPIPLLAIQLLWLNLITNGLQDAALAFEKGTRNVMEEKPRSTKESIFDGLLKSETFLSSLCIGIIVFIVYYHLIKIKQFDIIYTRSLLLLLMVFMQNLHTLNCRSEKTSLFKISVRNNYFVVLAILGALILQILVLQIPFFNQIFEIQKLSSKEMVSLFFLALPIVLVMEIFKKIKQKNNRII